MAKVTNNILLATIIALLTWSWTSYITNWQLISVLASIAATALFIVLTHKCSHTTVHNKPLTDSLAIHLAISPNSIQLIENMLRYYLYDTSIQDTQYIIATKADSRHLVYCHNSMDAVTPQCVCNIAKACCQHNCCNAIIISSTIDSSAQCIFDYCNIEAKHINMPSLYNQLVHAEMLPTLHAITVKKKSIVASYALCAHRARHYAISAVFLTIFSWLSYMPIYTLVWATVLLALAIYSKYNTRYNIKASPNLVL